MLTGADPGFWKGGGAWGVGDKLAVRLSQVCAPGGSEGMPLGTFEILDEFPAIWCIFYPKINIFYLYSVDERGWRAPPTPPPPDPRLA